MKLSDKILKQIERIANKNKIICGITIKLLQIFLLSLMILMYALNKLTPLLVFTFIALAVISAISIGIILSPIILTVYIVLKVFKIKNIRFNKIVKITKR